MYRQQTCTHANILSLESCGSSGEDRLDLRRRQILCLLASPRRYEFALLPLLDGLAKAVSALCAVEEPGTAVEMIALRFCVTK